MANGREVWDFSSRLISGVTFVDHELFNGSQHSELESPGRIFCEETFMPLENQAGEKSATQPHHAESDRWAEVSAILLDDAPISGAPDERLRTYNNAELMMCRELEKFSAEKFELVDTDKDGFISQLETKKALTNPTAGVPVDPNTALDYIGDEARTMRIHHVP
jgi:hypothetical protein